MKALAGTTSEDLHWPARSAAPPPAARAPGEAKSFFSLSEDEIEELVGAPW
jgi:hypothetical protein